MDHWPPKRAPAAANSAAFYASTALFVALPSESAGEALDRLSSARYDSLDRLWLVDAGGALAGAVPIARLLAASRSSELSSLADRPPPSVDAALHPERVALHAIEHDLDAVPVTSDGKLLGVVPARALVAISRREHVRDLHRLAGIAPESPEDEAAAQLLEPPTRGAAHRLPWLLVGLFGTLATGVVMTGFEEVLREDIAVAFFVPGIVYLADAVGTQTEALAVRGLSHVHQPLRILVARELGTGLLLGLLLGAICWPAIAVGWGDPMLGLAVALSVLIACAVATSVGLLLPWLLSARGHDPAFGSGPLATILQDVLSLLVYLTVISWLRPS